MVRRKIENAYLLYYITTIEERKTRVVFHDASGKEGIVQLYKQLCLQIDYIKPNSKI